MTLVFVAFIIPLAFASGVVAHAEWQEIAREKARQ